MKYIHLKGDIESNLFFHLNYQCDSVTHSFIHFSNIYGVFTVYRPFGSFKVVLYIDSSLEELTVYQRKINTNINKLISLSKWVDVISALR